MNRNTICALICGAAIGLPLSLQSPDASAQGADTAAERARIANERIRRDMQARQSTAPPSAAGDAAPTAPPQATSSLPYAAAQRPAPTGTYAPTLGAATATIAPAPAPSAGGGGEAMPENNYTRTLSQLRVLGELRDAGYLTDDEFNRIKTRIISSVF